MFEFIEITDDRRKEYDRIVAAQPDAHVFQSYEWGEVKASSWRPRRFIIRQEGKDAGGFQLLERYIKQIKRSIFYVPCGPAADLSDAALVKAFAGKIRELAKEKKAVFVKLDPPVPNERSDVKTAFKAAGFKLAVEEKGGFEGIQPRCVMHLDISGTEDEILANMTEKWRYNIRLAARKGVSVRQGSTDKDINEFYKILEVTGKRDGFLIRSQAYFKTMYEVMAPRDMIRLFLADYDGKVVAATIAIAFSDKCWYVYGASGNEYRNVMPNHALQWAMIKWAKERDCPVYDFRGVPCDLSPEHPLHGLVRFKKGFGAYPVKYVGEYEMTFAPFIALVHKHGMPAYTKLRKLLRK
ncbi:MAG: peptidoglycan bridge formation glycyltransferase FemA/FemB family protein [Actinomycetota bacterium]